MILVDFSQQHIDLTIYYLLWLRLLTFTETGLAVEMDLVLRQCLREFPHRHSVLLKQLVGTVAKVDPVCSYCF